MLVPAGQSLTVSRDQPAAFWGNFATYTVTFWSAKRMGVMLSGLISSSARIGAIGCHESLYRPWNSSFFRTAFQLESSKLAVLQLSISILASYTSPPYMSLSRMGPSCEPFQLKSVRTLCVFPSEVVIESSSLAAGVWNATGPRSSWIIDCQPPPSQRPTAFFALLFRRAVTS